MKTTGAAWQMVESGVDIKNRITSDARACVNGRVGQSIPLEGSPDEGASPCSNLNLLCSSGGRWLALHAQTVFFQKIWPFSKS